MRTLLVASFLLLQSLVLTSCFLNRNVESSNSSATSPDNPDNSNNDDTPLPQQSLTAPDVQILSSPSGATATFTANDPNHSYFQCRVDNGDWFTCTSPFVINDDSENLPAGFNGDFHVRSIAENGDYSATLDKDFYVDERPKGFNGIVKGMLDLPGGKTLYYGIFDSFQPSPVKSLLLIDENGNSSYSPIWGFDGKALYNLVYEKDTSGNYTGKILISGDFTKYRG